MDKIKLGISSCLLGENVRYDGGHKLDHYLKDTLGKFIEWVGVCPETECGLGVPREAMHLTGAVESPRLVTRNSGIDYTERMLEWAGKKLDILEKAGLCGFVFKSDSPSSGLRGVKVYGKNNTPVKKGVGVFAKEFTERFKIMPVEDDGRLHDDNIRENFIERVFVFKRWRDFIENDGSLKGLVEFHTCHKLLIMAHGPKAVSELGRLVAMGKNTGKADLYEKYIIKLMTTLQITATVKKNANVLQHIMGYFKQNLSSDEKAELLEIIKNYYLGFIPLAVPVTLLQHYTRKYNEPYLKKQHYLHPHPVELMLRNHV